MVLGKRTKAAVQGIVLAALMGLLTWHTISWHMNGQHIELFNGIGESTWATAKAVLYYVGLMAATGMLLGLFMERLTDVFGYEVERIEHFADEAEEEAALEERLEERVEEEALERVR